MGGQHFVPSRTNLSDCFLNRPPRLPAISNAKALADRHDGVLKIRETRNQFQIFGDLLRMRENVIGDDQRLLGDLGGRI